ncbi:hypothetical protein BCR35DRAFT_349421, partial [Leucosporidium creatinivorum]
MASLLDIANLDLASTPGQLPPAAEPAPAPPSAIPTAQAARIIQGQHTEVFVQAFADRVLVLVTQVGRIGCMIQVNPPPPGLPAPLTSTSNSLFPSLPPPHPSTILQPLFGVPPSPHAGSLHDLYANQVGAIVFSSGMDAGFSRPVLLGIALKPSKEEGDYGVSEEERQTFGEVMEMLQGCKVW